MDNFGQLSLEQELELQIIKDQATRLSLEQAQSYIVDIMRHIMVRDNLVEHLLATSGIPQKRYARAIRLPNRYF